METKQQGLGILGNECFLTTPWPSESLLPSLSLFPSVNPVSEFGFNPNSEIGIGLGTRLSRAAAGCRHERAANSWPRPARPTRCGSGEPRSGRAATSEFGFNLSAQVLRFTEVPDQGRRSGKGQPAESRGDQARGRARWTFSALGPLSLLVTSKSTTSPSFSVL